MREGGRPTVLRLITRLNVGGPARHALLLTRGLANTFPTVLATGRPAPSEGELTDPEVPVSRVPLVRPLRPRSDVAAFVAVRALAAQSGVRLVHTHTAKAGAIGRLAARSLPRRPRTVHTFHGHVLDGYFSGPVERAFVETERALARTTDVLLAISPEIRDELLDMRVGRPSQWHVIPLGLDLDEFLAVQRPTGKLRSDLGLPDDIPLLGVVGRLTAIKDHETALRALELLPGVHLALVGDGELRATIETSVARQGLSDRVHFTGWRDDMASVLSDLDVVVLSSRNEGTPVALIEALAAARPVVATDVGGVKAVVVDGVTGVLIPPGDAAALAVAVESLLQSPSRGAALAAAGRAHVAATFGSDRLLSDIRDLYAELL